MHALFDNSTSRSFISASYVKIFELVVRVLYKPIYVATLIGRFLVTDYMCKSCKLRIGSFEFTIDLIVLEIDDFDVTLRMD